MLLRRIQSSILFKPHFANALLATATTAPAVLTLRRRRMSSAAPNATLPRHDKVTVKAELKWLKLAEIEYTDVKNRKRKYEMMQRTTTKSNPFDAVAIVPLIRSKDKPLQTVLGTQCAFAAGSMKQYRCPLDKYTLENPAGLVDDGETAEQAALRELREECGLHGKVLKVTRPIYSDPGCSQAGFCYVFVDVDGDEPRNANPAPEPDEGEYIESFRMDVTDMHAFIERHLAGDERCTVDAKMYSLALGLSAAGDVTKLYK